MKLNYSSKISLKKIQCSFKYLKNKWITYIWNKTSKPKTSWNMIKIQKVNSVEFFFSEFFIFQFFLLSNNIIIYNLIIMEFRFPDHYCPGIFIFFFPRGKTEIVSFFFYFVIWFSTCKSNYLSYFNFLNNWLIISVIKSDNFLLLLLLLNDVVD